MGLIPLLLETLRNRRHAADIIRTQQHMDSQKRAKREEKSVPQPMSPQDFARALHKPPSFTKSPKP